MRRLSLIGALAVVAVVLAPASPVMAATPLGPYGGGNPFVCVVQDVGTGTDFPRPNDDPFCVEFDKTRQNLTGFGIVDFVLKEPARVAAASNKCFYHQTDHWTGSIVQGQQPTLWHWDGRYFFDKARGVGGVSVRNFQIGGQTADPRLLPGFPEEYKPFFGPGKGGVRVSLGAGEPRCKARVDTAAERRRVYRNAARSDD
jgi:hypothetical protein